MKKFFIPCIVFVILMSSFSFASPRDCYYSRNFTGWINNHHTFLINGKPALGWQEINNNWYFFEKNGTCAIGWRNNLYWNGSRGDYYFDHHGRMLANIFIDGRWLGADGKATTGRGSYPRSHYGSPRYRY